MKPYLRSSCNFFLKFSPLCIGLIGSIYFHSRAFSIGLILAIIVVYLIDRKISLSKRTCLLITAGVLILLCYSIFFIKTDSSLGRVFIYKISLYVFKDNWFYGVGLGEFKNTYMYYQAAYFKFGQFTEKEFLLADNTYYAFNDYFQFVIEAGLIGICIIVVSFIGLYKVAKKALYNSNSRVLLNAIGFLIAIFIAAFFNYVLYKIEFQIAIIVCIMIVIYYFFLKTTFRVRIFSLVVILLFLILYYVYSYLTLNYYFALSKLKEVKELERAGYRTEALAIAKTLQKDLDGTYEYLELTSFIYTNAMMLKEAKDQTNKLIKARVSSDAYSRLAYIYEMNNEYKEAEKAYLMAIDMVPNRFIPRYNLFKLLKSTGQHAKSRICAREILNMPVKIPSPIIDQIKSNVKRSIN